MMETEWVYSTPVHPRTHTGGGEKLWLTTDSSNSYIGPLSAPLYYKHVTKEFNETTLNQLGNSRTTLHIHTYYTWVELWFSVRDIIIIIII